MSRLRPWNIRRGRTLEQRFWEKVDTSGGAFACWPWMGARAPKGYGVMARGVARSGGNVMAHRVALELQGVTIPQRADVMHSCDNPPCCNPSHLSVGTRAENMADMARKGRHFSRQHPEWLARGERHGNAKLTAEAVAEIRTSDAPPTVLSARLGISVGHVRAVRRGDSWRAV